MFVNHVYAYDRNVDAQFYVCILQPNDPQYQFVDKSSLDDFEKDILRDILSHFKEIFSNKLPQGLPPSLSIHHKINLVPSAKLVSIAPYMLSRTNEDEITQQIKEYLRMEHIQYSKSSWGALIVLAKKKDGTWRMYVNYKGLNKLTIRNSLPRSDDLRFGYHQIKISEEDCHEHDANHANI